MADPLPALEHLADAMLAVDSGGAVTFANAAARRLLGIRAATGQPLEEVWPQLLEDGQRAMLQEAMTARRTATFLVCLPGPARPLRVRAVPTMQGPTGLMLVAREANVAEQASEVLAYTAALAEADTVEDIVRALATLVLPAFDADGVLLAILESGQLRLAGHVGYDAFAVEAIEALDLTESPPVAEIMRTRVPVFLPGRDAYLRRYPSLESLIDRTRKQAWAFLPLVVSGRFVGALTVSYDRAHDFPPEERSLLAGLGGLIAQTLARARLREAERTLAAELQNHLLPRELSDVAGLVATARYLPATDGMGVGGDWYDVLALPGHHVGFVIGDVQGHNMHAAAVMGQLRNALRAYAAEGHDPSAVLSRTNRLMADLDPSLFATCCFLRVNQRSGEAEMAVAGHPPPLLCSQNGEVRSLTCPVGPPLGVLPDVSYATGPVVLSRGDVVAFFTDGMLEELRRPYDEAVADLGRQLQRADRTDLEGLADALVATAIGTGVRSDDVALLLVRLLEPAADAEHARTVVDRQDPRAARAARDFLVRFLPQPQLGDVRDTSELLVSEVVTNALRHTDGAIHLALWRYPDRIRVEVADETSRPPVVGVTDLLDESGRGVPLMDALSDRWGTAPHGAGKVVWFELHLPPPS